MYLFISISELLQDSLHRLSTQAPKENQGQPPPNPGPGGDKRLLQKMLEGRLQSLSTGKPARPSRTW